MNRYNYKAIDQSGKYVKGDILADNPIELGIILNKQGLELVKYSAQGLLSSKFFAGSVSQKDVIEIFIHLEQMERAGISILDSITDLRDGSSSSAVKNLTTEVLTSIKEGLMFSDTLAKYPKTFSKVYVGLISSGEKTGSLSTAFNSIIEDIKWNMDIKRKIRKATLGPLFGIFMMFTVIGVMTTLVVPKITSFLKEQNIQLPLATTALIAFSDFMQKYWYLIIIMPVITFVLTKLLRKISLINLYLDKFWLKMPIFGAIIIKVNSAKFCQFFGITFKSGLSVVECLDSAGEVINNLAIRQSIEVIKYQITNGKTLTEGIKSSGYFPNLVVRMFKIGEESGNMEESLKNIKFFYDKEINDSIDRIIGLIQPTLTLIMGGMVAWIAISVFGPIYASFSNSAVF
jgi:type IV pilus assembly protein PilC